jgi:chromosome partitioning protein
MRTIAVLNQKGGVGKTTTVVNTAAALAALGAKVMAIDFDPQAHLTIHLGIEPASINSGSYRVLTHSARLESEIMMVRPNLWLLPANIDLVGAESELVSVVGREIILREALQECQQNFDYCIIDCAPSLGLLTLNALAAAQEVLIPLQPHFLALQGFGKLLQTVEIVNRRINPALRVNGILLCMFDSRASLPNEVKADIERFLNDARGTNSAWAEAHVLPVLVRRNIKLAEAPSYGQTIFEYESTCHGAEDYQKVAEFIHDQTNRPEELSETVEIQEQSEQQIESETLPAYSNQEQTGYSIPDETMQQEDFQDQTQVYEESEPAQTDDTSDAQESSNETVDVRENINQPEQTNNQPEYSSEIPQQPPIEIREIQSHDSHETDQYTQISEEENHPDQTNNDPEYEHKEY